MGREHVTRSPLARMYDTTRRLTPRYVSEIVPMICEPGDDEQHGSSVVCDVNALQALSRRVHLGKFVAESKFQVSVVQQQVFRRGGRSSAPVLRDSRVAAAMLSCDLVYRTYFCDDTVARRERERAAQ